MTAIAHKLVDDQIDLRAGLAGPHQGRGLDSVDPGGLLAAAIEPGRIIGKTNATGEQVAETGWKYTKQQIKTENVYASIYSALGIDWRKELTNTPAKRAYRYIDMLGATEMAMDDEIADLFV